MSASKQTRKLSIFDLEAPIHDLRRWLEIAFTLALDEIQRPGVKESHAFQVLEHATGEARKLESLYAQVFAADRGAKRDIVTADKPKH